MDELLDVLDEWGGSTGIPSPRSEVHKLGLWHGTVHVYVCRVVEARLELLVHLRSPLKDLYPNAWDPVLGGHIQSGRTPQAAVIEELAGEIGLTVSENDLSTGPVFKADKGLDREFNYLFVSHLPHAAKIRFEDKEVRAIVWMEPELIFEAIRMSSQKWRPTLAEFSKEYEALSSLMRS